MSDKFENLKTKYDRNYITKDMLKGWVRLNTIKVGKGITADEYELITGEAYE